jgi:hypothetical protein
MPATPLRAQLSDEELLCHEHARSTRPPDSVRPGQHRQGFAVAICEIGRAAVGQPAGTDLPASSVGRGPKAGQGTQADGASNVSRLDPAGVVHVDAEHPARMERRGGLLMP